MGYTEFTDFKRNSRIFCPGTKKNRRAYQGPGLLSGLKIYLTVISGRWIPGFENQFTVFLELVLYFFHSKSGSVQY